jgi:hypothetical protein
VDTGRVSNIKFDKLKKDKDALWLSQMGARASDFPFPNARSGLWEKDVPSPKLFLRQNSGRSPRKKSAKAAAIFSPLRFLLESPRRGSLR